MPKSARRLFYLAALLLTVAFATTACQTDARYQPLAVGAQMLLADRLLPPVASATAADGTEMATTAGTVAVQPAPAQVTMTTTQAVTPTVAALQPASEAPTAPGLLDLTPEQQAIAEESAVYSPNAPVVLVIPALALTSTVTAMGWETVMSGDQVTTRWVVPQETVGWAVNSAGAGEPDNMVLVGHQMLGAAPLRALALDQAQPGQDIYVTTARGIVTHYVVSSVSPPIPAIGATPEETAQSAAFFAPTGTSVLTMVTGWPSDVSTHRVFVRAALAATQP